MDTAQRCQHCGKALGEKAVHGLCPECLMKVGLGSGASAEGGAAHAGRFIPPTPEELAGRFPQLEILELVGRGGMGAVYKARQKELDRIIALKVLPPEAVQETAFAERFTREARALAQLNHPSIVAVFDFGRAGGLYYLVMEFVDGVNLRQMLQAHRLEPREAMSIVPQICEALQYAHDRGIVHRDIKPENILVDKQGRVKIADFGLARLLGKDPQAERLTQAAEVMGTPQYMAPEQLEKPLEVDHRADIYSLGVVFYEMLTGELPLGRFAAPSRKVHVDVRFDEIVLRALEKEPSLRYQQAGQISTDVATCRDPAPDQSSTARQKRKMNSNNKTLWAGLGVGVSTCLILAAAIWMFAGRGNAAKLSQEGWELWQARRLPEATAKFERAVKFAPNNAEAWNGLGWATFNSGKWQEGESAFKKVIELQPSHPAALNGLGQIYLAQGRLDDAEGVVAQGGADRARGVVRIGAPVSAARQVPAGRAVRAESRGFGAR